MGNKILKVVFMKCVEWRLFNFIPDEQYLKMLYRIRVGRKLHLEAPKTFNEKIQWLKLHDHNPEYTTMVDKYAAKKWVADQIGEQYVIPTLGVWEHFDDIDLDALPDQFVLKCTHDSGSIVIVKDKAKMDKKAARKKLEAGLRRNWYDYAREWAYKNVPPRIIAEAYLMNTLNDNCADSEIIDNWKFYCQKGKIFALYVTRGGGHQRGMTLTYFDRQGRRLPVKSEQFPVEAGEIKMPDTLEEMIGLAETLSKKLPFLRVDFLLADNKMYIGELTFYPFAGLGKLEPDSYDLAWGNEIFLTLNAKEG